MFAPVHTDLRQKYYINEFSVIIIESQDWVVYDYIRPLRCVDPLVTIFLWFIKMKTSTYIQVTGERK